MDTAEALAARLRGNPEDHEAYSALKALYLRNGEYGSLANLIAGWAAWVPDDRAASQAYAEVGTLLLQQLNDPAQAETCYLEALRRDPLNATPSDALEALWTATAEHAKHIEFLQQRIQTLSRLGVAQKQLALLRYRLGELWGGPLGRSVEALHHFRKAFETDPEFVRAYYEARKLCIAAGDLRGAAELYEREANAEQTPERKVALLTELSALCRDQLDDLDSAVSALERAQALVPDDAALAYELAGLLVLRSERADERTALGDRARAADLLTLVAASVDPEQAIPYLESALSYAPAHETALTELERLLEGGPGEARLAAAWVAYLSASADGRNAHKRRVKLARAYAREGQIADAIFCLTPAADAGHAGARDLLRELRGEGDGRGLSTRPPPAGRRERALAEPTPAHPRPAPALRQPPEDRSMRATVDLGEVKTVVGERQDLIASTREASAPPPLGIESEEPPADSAFDDLEELEEIDETADPANAFAHDEVGPSITREAPYAPAAAPPPPPPAVPYEEPAREWPEHDTLADADAPEAPSVGSAPSEALPAVYAPEPAPERLPDSELAALRRAAAQLAREQRLDEAARSYEFVLASDPLDRDAFAFLDAHYRRRQQHQERAPLLERSATIEGLPLRVRVARLREAASTYEARLKDVDAAIRCFRRLAELDPESDDAQRALKRLLERAERWDELARVFEAEVAREHAAEAKLPLLKRLVALHRERRGDRAAAADALERMLMLKPDDRALRDALLENLLALARYEEALPLFERKIEEAATRPQKLAVLQQVAALCRNELKDSDRAFAVYERMLALSPGDEGTLDRMAELDEASGNFARMLQTLERKAAQAQGPRAAAVYARMAEVAEQRLQDAERASELLSRAVDAAPESPAHLEALCSLYERFQRYDDLVELLRERVLMEQNPKARVELYRRIALVLRDRLADAEGAYDAWRHLLELAEDHEALTALHQRALERDDAAALVDLLGRLAAIEPDPGERRDLLFDRARLLSARLARPAAALPDLVRILLEIDPDFEHALSELWTASEAAGDYHGLSRVLEQRLKRTTVPEQRVEYARKLAEVYEQKLNDADRAAHALAAWAEAAPANAEPHRRLAPLLVRARRYPELLAAYDALTRLEPSTEARQQAAIAAADVCQRRLSDPNGAWERLAPLADAGVPDAIKALTALAQSEKRLGELYDLLERAGLIDRLLALLRERAAREQDSKTRASLLRRTAQILIEYTQDEDAAAEVYERLLQLEEDSDALRFLQARAQRNDDPATLSDVLRRLAALEPSREERRDLLLEHARLLRARLDRPGDAIAVLRELLAEEPEHPPIAEELLAAAEAARDYPTVAATLERELARAHSTPDRVRLAARLADVCERDLGDIGRAIAALQRWAAADPGDPQPQRRLRPHLLASGRDRELLACLDALAANEADDAARLEATLSAAALAHGRLGDAEGAFGRLTPHIPAANPKVDQALLLLAMELGRLDELYALLEQARRYDTVVELLRQRVSTEADPNLRADLYLRMARTLAGPLEDEAGAEYAFSRLLGLREDEEALQFLRTRALRRDDMELLCDCLKRLAALESDPNERRDLLYEYGHLLHSRLGRPAQAIAVLRAVIEQLDPDFEPALDELLEAATAAGDRATEAFALEHVLRRESDLERRIELARRLVGLYQDHLRDVDRALQVLGHWAQLTPSDAEPHHRAAALLAGSGRHGELLYALDAIAEREADPVERAEALLKGAELAYRELRDADAAWARAVLLANTGNDRAEALLSRLGFEGGKLQALIELYEAGERYDDLVGVLRERAESETDAAAKAELYRRCARLLAGPLGDEVAAAEAFREVLRAGEDLEALQFLRTQALHLDDPEELSELLDRLARLVTDRTQQRDLLFERALLLGDRLERATDAAAVLRRVLELDPGHVPAMEELIANAELREDIEGLCFALEQKLAIEPKAASRADLASRLATLYEDELASPDKTLGALRVWAAADPRNPEPLRRAWPLLERAQQWTELLAVLDALAECEGNTNARSEAVLTAAAIAHERLGDADGAFRRLSPQALAYDRKAEQAARELAKQAGLARPLASLYVLRAKAGRAEHAVSDWVQAAIVFEEQLREPGEAFEASLRALGLDLGDRALLDRIDRLANVTGSWERLLRVYGRLAQEAKSKAERLELVCRSAELLERDAKDSAAALALWLEACGLDPSRDDLLERAERLAELSASPAELVYIYERRHQNAQTDEQRGRHLLRAARTADLSLKDREQALRNLARALTLTETVPQLASEIEALAAEFDRVRPELGGQDARRGLVQAHLDLAQRAGDAFGPILVRRAARILREELSDQAACFDALKQGVALFPNDLELYDALEQTAVEIRRLDALDAHLARCGERATDQTLKVALLRRRGKLLAERLERPAKAAEVYRALCGLDPNDPAAFSALIRSLRQAGRFKELLDTIDDRVAKTNDLEGRLQLMREMAAVWEVELRNRPGAIEVWQKVRALAPDDAEASAALTRLQS